MTLRYRSLLVNDKGIISDAWELLTDSQLATLAGISARYDVSVRKLAERYSIEQDREDSEACTMLGKHCGCELYGAICADGSMHT